MNVAPARSAISGDRSGSGSISQRQAVRPRKRHHAEAEQPGLLWGWRTREFRIDIGDPFVVDDARRLTAGRAARDREQAAVVIALGERQVVHLGQAVDDRARASDHVPRVGLEQRRIVFIRSASADHRPKTPIAGRRCRSTGPAWDPSCCAVGAGGSRRRSESLVRRRRSQGPS